MKKNNSLHNDTSRLQHSSYQNQPVVQKGLAVFTGPLPPPEVLAKYDDIQEGFADRIITMAEKQSEHRRDLEKNVVNSGLLQQKWGLISATVINIAALACGTLMVLKGYSPQGIIAVSPE